DVVQNFKCFAHCSNLKLILGWFVDYRTLPYPTTHSVAAAASVHGVCAAVAQLRESGCDGVIAFNRRDRKG
ncbi:hypothetical protein O5470_23985, partial [Escherichia coli]|nr:hypothetical protein [Escherichia coli]